MHIANIGTPERTSLTNPAPGAVPRARTSTANSGGQYLSARAGEFDKAGLLVAEACWPHQVREEGNQGSGQRDPMQKEAKEQYRERTRRMAAEAGGDAVGNLGG